MFHNHEVDKRTKNVVTLHVVIPTKLTKKSEFWKLKWLSVYGETVDFTLAYGTPISRPTFPPPSLL